MTEYALVHWIRENGGYVDKELYLDSSNSLNRVVRSRAAFAPSEVFIRIPDVCCIRGDLYEVCLKLIVELSKGYESFYQPYLAMLPTEEELGKYLPIYKYKRSEIAELVELSPIFANQMNVYFKEIDEFYTNVLQKAENIPDAFKKYRYAVYAIAIYHSRAWNKQGLIPYIDLINHENNVILTGNVIINDGESKFRSARYVNPGDEITWCYSMNNNISLYANYGIPLHSENVYIPTQLNWTDHSLKTDLAEYIRKCLISNGFNPESEIRIAYSDKGLHINAINVSRILNLTQDEIREEVISINDDKIVSLRNEGAALSVFIKQLRSLIPSAEPTNEKYPELVAIVRKNMVMIRKIITELEERWAKLLTTFS